MSQSLFLVAGQTGHGHGPATATRPRPGHGQPASRPRPPGHPATATRPRPRPPSHTRPARRPRPATCHGHGHRARPPDQDSATQPLATRQSCCFTGYKGGCCELCRLVWRCSFKPTSWLQELYTCSMRSWNLLKCWFYIFVTTRAP